MKAAQSQRNDSLVANKISQKMQDSLQLTSEQRGQVFTINIQLHEQKSFYRDKYAGTDSVRYYLQKVENTRDSLYRRILPENKYMLYRQKKRNLVNVN